MNLNVSVEEVFAHLSERGRLEWELASYKVIVHRQQEHDVPVQAAGPLGDPQPNAD